MFVSIEKRFETWMRNSFISQATQPIFKPSSIEAILIDLPQKIESSRKNLRLGLRRAWNISAILYEENVGLFSLDKSCLIVKISSKSSQVS
jgi:hypothetical protein